ncbi:hypothetical protein [Rhizomonospora bruguierae]|uniref:hypothetical protein n=1 Tax=Rhizomonospora bruguierae TaxID=1581705 RepID=UPI001BD1571F|nr:hypothetical protein [Micromonospora sp. NBRC 107566]
MGALLGQFVTQLPLLIVLVVGGVLLLTRRERLSRRSGTLGLTGLGVLLIGLLGNVLWMSALPQFYRRLGNGYAALTIMSLLLALVHTAGIGLLIGAIITNGRSAGTPGPGAPGQYLPPSAPPGWGGVPQPPPPYVPQQPPPPQQQNWTPPAQPPQL